jgi:SPP1 family phage portal protein
MKQDRVLLLDADGDASFLVKSMADAQTQERLDKIEEKIYKIANCVDFYNTDFITSASSGTALRYRLMGMENNASTIESAFRKGVQKRVELIYSILSMTEGEDLWRDVEIVFTRNIPDLTTPQTPQEIMAYRNFVSDKTLLGLLNFVESPEEEIAEVQKQLASAMSLYNFAVKEDEDEQVLDEEEDR